MNKLFDVPNINEDGQRYYAMDTNVLAGFKKSVAQGQPNLALTYLTYVVDILAKKVEACTCGAESPAPLPERHDAEALGAKTEEEPAPKPARLKKTPGVQAE